MMAGICFKAVWVRGLTKQSWPWDKGNMGIFYTIIFMFKIFHNREKLSLESSQKTMKL